MSAGRAGGGSFTIQEECPTTSEPARWSGPGMLVDPTNGEDMYEEEDRVRSCGVGMLVDFDSGHLLRPEKNNGGTLGLQRLHGGVDKVQPMPFDPNKAARDQEEDEDEAEKQRISTGTMPTAASTTARMSLASASSVESSFRSSKSKGSMQSLMNRNSSRKIMVSNLPRHSRRNKKQKEMTWLRDTLSLTSSTHSDYIASSTHLSATSDEDYLQDSFGGSNPSLLNGSQSSRGLNGSGRGMNGSSGRASGRLMAGSYVHDQVRRGSGQCSHHQRTASSPAFLESLEERDLFPKANRPLPAIMASSVSSQSEVDSSNKEDPRSPDASHRDCSDGCEDCQAEREEKGKDEEEELESEAPIKWVTATISNDDTEELPPPPPRDSTPRSSRGDRWGRQDNSDSSDQRRRPRSMTPPKRTETMPRGGHRGLDAGQEQRRDMDGSGERIGESLYPRPPLSVAPSVNPSLGAARGSREERPGPPTRYRSSGALTSTDGYREETHMHPRGRVQDPRGHPRDHQEEQSRSNRYQSPRGEDRYQSRERFEPRNRSPGRYPPRDRSPGRYPPRDISPGRYPPRDRSPERYLPRDRSRREMSPGRYPRDRSPGHYPPRDRSPERYPRDISPDRRHTPRNRSQERYPVRDFSPDRRYSSRDYGPPPHQRWRGEHERSFYSRRRDDPYEQDYRRSGYGADPYGYPRGGGDDRILSPRDEDYDRHHPRDRSYPNGHSEVQVRTGHRNYPPAHDHERSPYYPEDDPYRWRGNGPSRGHSSRGFSRDDPAHDGYPGPPPFSQDYPRRGNGPRDDRHNDRHPQGRPLLRQEDPRPGRDSRYASSPTRQGQESSKPRDNKSMDQDLLDEKLKSSGLMRGGGVKDEPVSVEIAPGVRVPLRRTLETMQAVAVDFYQEVCCLSCSMDLFSIADVSYVICPRCRVISPVGGEYFEGREIRRHGLGLGFTCESLFKMQAEIVQDRSKYEKKEQQPNAPKNEYHYEKRQRAPISRSHY